MNRVSEGDTGLLLANLKNPFDGYTTLKPVKRKSFAMFLKRAMLGSIPRFGDLQKHGHIQFGDRIGDTFRWQGENVATTEVGVIMKWPEIEDAVVYGVTVPGRDGRCGMLH